MAAPVILPTAKRKRIRIGGCPVDCLDFDGAVRELAQRIEGGIPTHVAFVNIFKIAMVRTNPELRAAIEKADLLLADGMPVVWASRLLRSPLPARVTGIDLMQAMLALGNERGYRVFLLGATQDVVARTAKALQARHPNLRVVGYRDGYFGEQDEDELIDSIRRVQPDLLFVGISTPKKETWTDRNLHKLSTSVCQGVGGSFDVLVGRTRRAPAWMQRSGLEWLYRVGQEPRRLLWRYMQSGALFAALVLQDLIRLHVRQLRSRDSRS